MKKVFALMFVALAAMLALPAQAQLKFGVKGGLNISKVKFSKSDFNSDNRTGFFIGPMAEFTLPIVGLGVDAAALYTQSGAKVNNADETVSSSTTLKTIEVPINLKYNIGLGSTLGAFVAVGPQFGFNVGSGHIDSYNVSDSNVTFNAGVGVKLVKHLQIGLNYNFALSKTAKYQNDSMRKNTWQISAAYLF